MLLATLAAQAGVVINEVNFPDANFRNYLKRVFGGDVITDSQIANLKTLNVSNMDIRSLQGIQKFTALESLDCSHNKLQYLDGFSNAYFKNLVTLRCNDNLLTELDVSYNKKLKVLDCSRNLLTFFYLHMSLTDLESVNVSNNRLTSFSLRERAHLVSVDISYNQGIEHVDFSSNPVLKQLSADQCTGIRTFVCRNCSLTSLSLNGCTSIFTLDCSENNLTSLSILACKALQELDCHYNNLTSLNLNGLNNLSKVDCSSNKLTYISMTDCPLVYYYCHNNQLTALGTDCFSKGQMKYVDCYGNKFTSITQDNSDGTLNNLEYIDAGFNQAMTSFTFKNCPKLDIIRLHSCANLQTLDCSANALTTLETESCTALKTINCSSNQMTYVKLVGCPEVNTLNASNNNFTQLDITNRTALQSLDLSKCAKLKFLHCENNSLTSLNVASCPLLQSVICSDNNLTSLTINNLSNLITLDVSGNSNLKTLDCSNNAITSFYYSGCKALETLNCSNNPWHGDGDLNFQGYDNLKTLNLSNLENLDYLKCYENRLLSSLNISGCNNLAQLMVDYTALPQLNVSNLNKLTTFSCSNNSAMTKLDCNNNPKLNTLTVMGNPALATLNCSNNSELQTFNCSYNGLKTLNCPANPMLATIFLHDCPTLENVYFNNCALTELDLSNYPALKTIQANDNQLTKLKAQGCTALQHLLLQNNPALSRANTTFETGELLELNISKTQGVAYDFINNMPKLQSLFMDELSNIVNMDIHNNPNLNTLSMKNCPTLQNLYCDINALNTIDVEGNTALQNFSCSNNNLTTLDLSGLIGLKSLGIYNNQIKEAGMQELVGSLPSLAEPGTNNFYVMYDASVFTSEGNEMTIPQAQAANEKGWEAMMYGYPPGQGVAKWYPIMQNLLVGDVNSDGVVDVDDLNIVINIIVRKASNEDWPAADVNGDGTVDVDDMNRIINIMVHKE